MRETNTEKINRNVVVTEASKKLNSAQVMMVSTLIKQREDSLQNVS